MKVILLKDVADVGKEGDLVNVKPGYFNNFLAVRQLAVQATPEALKNWKAIQKQKKKIEAANREEAEKVKAQVEAMKLTLKAKAGENGRLFGSVTSQDIVDGLAAQGVEVDKKKIDLDEPIRELGEKQVAIKVYPGIKASLAIEVVAVTE